MSDVEIRKFVTEREIQLRIRDAAMAKSTKYSKLLCEHGLSRVDAFRYQERLNALMEVVSDIDYALKVGA